MTLFPGVTMSTWSAFGAGALVASPDCDARNTTKPGPVIVRMFPLAIAGPDKTEKFTGKPELAVADSANGASPNTCLLNPSKVMNCGSFATTKLRSTSNAELKFVSPDCAARTVTVPAPVSVTTLLLTV